METTALFFESADGTLMPASAVPCLIGRAPTCALRLPSPEVSRRHAVIIRDRRDWWLVDCGSKGGTWLNNARIASAARLQHGDLIGIGLATLKFLPHVDPDESIRTRSALLETTRPGETEWLVTSETAVAWIDDSGQISNCTPTASLWLHAFFDDLQHGLPSCLCDWLHDAMASTVPYERKVGEERLRIISCRDQEGARLLVMSRLKPAFSTDALMRIGLSKAEAVLVPWLIRGKRNEEMALIVGLAPKTVEKHVASILFKLKVETRTAAAWSIIELSGAHW